MVNKIGNIPCYYCFGCCYLADDRSRVLLGYRFPLLPRRIRDVDESFRSRCRFRFRFRWCFVVDIDLGCCCFGGFVVVGVVVVEGSCRLRLFRFLAAAVVVVVDDIDS